MAIFRRGYRLTSSIIFSAAASLFSGVNFSRAQAPNLQDAFGQPLRDTAGAGAGYNTLATADSFIGLVIQAALSLLGVVFLVLAIYAGYNWMTARGEEEKVNKAKDTLTNSVIGLVIVMAAYAISYYVINALGNAALK
ncbi:MAG: pilin [bacterium]|nr:pilin [bacterium]